MKLQGKVIHVLNHKSLMTNSYTYTSNYLFFLPLSLNLYPSLPLSHSYYHSRSKSDELKITSIPITVASFTSTHFIVRVAKRPGMERVSLLQNTDTPTSGEEEGGGGNSKGGIFDSITK